MDRLDYIKEHTVYKHTILYTYMHVYKQSTLHYTTLYTILVYIHIQYLTRIALVLVPIR